MKKHKLLSLTLATFITLGSIAPAIYSPKLAYAKDIDENDSKINNQQTSESIIKKEDKTEENLGVKPQENHDQKVEEKTEKKSEEKLDISPEKNPKPQSSQQAQTRGAEESQVEGTMAISTSIPSQYTGLSLETGNKLESNYYVPTGAITDIKVEFKASNKGNAKPDDKIDGLKAKIKIPKKRF